MNGLSIIIANQDLKDTVVRMDDHHFENCTIDHCILVFSGGDFSWKNCRFVNCQVRFVGAAGKTIQFVKYFEMASQVPKAVKSTESSLVH